MGMVVLLLAHAKVDDINSPISARDLRRPLHVACSVACLPIVQLLLWVNTVRIFNDTGIHSYRLLLWSAVLLPLY